MEELISVIVPVYNKEKYIRDCIESIIGQTYTKLEILLINDGSTDNSEEICKAYEKNDSRIKLITTENRGAACARNMGIEMANGKYLSFIDADDYIEKHYYEIMLNLLQQYNAQIAECDFARIIETKNYEFPEKIGQIRVMNAKESLIELYGKGDKEHVKTVIMCNKLFEKKLFQTVRYIPNRVIDDETIIYRLLEKCKTIVETNDTLYGYVQSSNSIMRKDFSMKRLEDSITVYDECIEYFKNDLDIQACCLKRAIFFYGEFLEKIIKSNNIDKEKAYQIVNENFNQKRKQLEEIQTPIKEKINWEDTIKMYKKSEEIYFN